MDYNNFFDQGPGAYVLVDGQFGSTGKGVAAAYLATHDQGNVTHVTTNAGPNSGHTAYFGTDKIMTQQIPVASVFFKRFGRSITTLLNAGAIIDPAILNKEHSEHRFSPYEVLIHPTAALITELARQEDQAVLGAVAGTGKGVGPALAKKIGRVSGQTAFDYYRPMLPPGMPNRGWDNFWDWRKDVVFVETAQGFSLGLNTARFYPHTTSRECTVMQALTDARIPAQMLKKVIACFRTYPIRVGNTQGSSGGCYEDQQELQWEDLGLEPELTTVTKRKRRIFSWSRQQFKDCIAANRPEVIFLNFCNYLSSDDLDGLLQNIEDDYLEIIGRLPEAILTGWSPDHNDIRVEHI